MRPIEVEQEIHAHWEINPDGYYPYCSNCKTEPKGREMTDYCPNCGAKMNRGRKGGMTNRQYYITKRNEYDLMISLVSHYICPIKAISDQKPQYQHCIGEEEECGKCIQRWLNEEVKPIGD